MEAGTDGDLKVKDKEVVLARAPSLFSSHHDPEFRPLRHHSALLSMFLLRSVVEEEDGLRGHFNKKTVDNARTRKRGIGLRWDAREAGFTADASLTS